MIKILVQFYDKLYVSMKTHSTQLIFLLVLFFIGFSKKSDASIDIGATALLSPETGFGLGAEPITIEITNFGDEPVSDFEAYFSVDGGAVYGEILTLTLDAGETIEYTFSLVVDFSALGEHNVCAWTYTADDDISSNDSTCTTIISLKVVDLGDTTITACGSLVLDAENIGTEYLWSTGETTPSISVSESGVYWVEVTEPVSGLVEADTIEVTIDSTVIADFGLVSYFDAHIEFFNSSVAAESYLWDFGDGDTSTETNPVHYYTIEDEYTITLIATNACSVDTSTIIFNDWPHAIFEIETPEEITLHPNPASEYVYFLESFKNKIIEIYNMLGIKMQYTLLDDKINISELPSGNYILYCEGMAGKFMKE